MPKVKYEIRMLKDLPGIKKGTTKSVDKVTAVDMVERKNAEFVNDDDANAIISRKEAIAKYSNESMSSTKKKRKQISKADDDRAAKTKADDKRKLDRQLNLVLGRRKSLLKKHETVIDLSSEEFTVNIETTKEEFTVMLEAAKLATATTEEERLTNQANIDAFPSRKEELSEYGEHAKLEGLTETTTVEEFNLLLSDAVTKFNEHLFNQRKEELSEYSDFVDVSLFTEETTGDEFEAMLASAKAAKESKDGEGSTDSTEKKKEDPKGPKTEKRTLKNATAKKSGGKGSKT